MINVVEETDRAQRIKMSDPRALDKIVQANLRFVVSVAKQCQHQGLSLSECTRQIKEWAINVYRKNVTVMN